MDDKEWREIVWSEIKELRSEVKQISKDNAAILETITTMKVKLGVIVSVFSGAITFAWNYIEKKLNL
jgi:hypothetical protein